LALWQKAISQGFFNTLYEIWSPYWLGTPIAWSILAIFAATQLLFMKMVPGKEFKGPPSPKGNIPVYKANGVLSYVLTIAIFCLTSFYLRWFDAAILYDNLGGILGALNLFSLFYCLFLYVKGRFFPSSTDNGITGNFIFDYYWGTELYPRLAGWD